MAQNKHKTIRRIICILCACIIALYALSIPIGAVVNSSQVGLGQTGLYGESTFPFTVGFVQRDDTLDRNYIFATEIGGYGQGGNQTVEGSDIFYWNYPDASDEESSAITYIQGDKVWLNSLSYRDVNPDTGAVGSYKGGYSSIDLQYNTISPDFDSTTESIIFKASNIYFNPIWLTEIDGDSYKFKNLSSGYDYMMPVIYLPILDAPTTQKFVGAYSVEATVIDMNGQRHWIRYSVPIDTSITLNSYPFIDATYLKQFINPEDIDVWLSGEVDGSNSTICIEEYRGYLDVDYYEYVEPSIEEELPGTWIWNDVPSFAPLADNTNISWRFDIYSGGIQFSGIYVDFKNSSSTINSITMDDDGDMMPTAYGGQSWYSGYQTFTIPDGETDVVSSYGNYSLKEFINNNATKQGSTATVAEEGTWEKVTDSELLNKCLVSYPLYDTSAVTDPTLSAQTWLAYPTAEKMLSGVISMHEPDEIINIPEIDDDMYRDYTGWLGTAVKGFFDTPLLGGMSLGVIVGVIVMFSCAIALLKIFAGG